jgi:succinate-acetate transporter protein
MLARLGILLISLIGVFCSINLKKYKVFKLLLLSLSVISFLLAILLFFYNNVTIFNVAKYLSLISSLIPLSLIVSDHKPLNKK